MIICPEPMPNASSRRITLLGAALPVVASLLLVAIALATGAQAAEEPRFTRVVHEGDFEIRDYRAGIAAELTLEGSRKDALFNSFETFAQYVLGNNADRKRLPLTVPVTQTEIAAIPPRIAPTVPTDTAHVWTIRLFMSARYSLAQLPKPMDRHIQFVSMPAARLAVVRFSGLGRAEDLYVQSIRLQEFVSSKHLQTVGPVIYLRYNTPWMPGAMRRNELGIEIVTLPKAARQPVDDFTSTR